MGEVLPQLELLPSETTVLEALASADMAWSQCKLAHQIGYSIGLIDTILKKPSKTGYIKITSYDSPELKDLLGLVMRDSGLAFKLRVFDGDDQCMPRVYLRGAAMTASGPQLNISMLASANGGGG